MEETREEVVSAHKRKLSNALRALVPVAQSRALPAFHIFTESISVSGYLLRTVNASRSSFQPAWGALFSLMGGKRGIHELVWGPASQNQRHFCCIRFFFFFFLNLHLYSAAYNEGTDAVT